MRWGPLCNRLTCFEATLRKARPSARSSPLQPSVLAPSRFRQAQPRCGSARRARCSVGRLVQSGVSAPATPRPQPAAREVPVDPRTLRTEGHAPTGRGMIAQRHQLHGGSADLRARERPPICQHVVRMLLKKIREPNRCVRRGGHAVVGLKIPGDPNSAASSPDIFRAWRRVRALPPSNG